MDWTNVYNSTGLQKQFGGVAAIPKLFLIDPSGKIIYNRNFKLNDDEKLSRLNKRLRKELYP